MIESTILEMTSKTGKKEASTDCTNATSENEHGTNNGKTTLVDIKLEMESDLMTTSGIFTSNQTHTLSSNSLRTSDEIKTIGQDKLVPANKSKRKKYKIDFRTLEIQTTIAMCVFSMIL